MRLLKLERVLENFIDGYVLSLRQESFGELLYFLSSHSIRVSLGLDLFSKQFSQVAKDIGRVDVFLYFEL